jgi:3-oxoacid CoA-transferase A subunit
VIDKVLASARQAVDDIPDGAVLAVGGFAGPGGIPSELIEGLAQKQVGHLTVISNDAARGTAFFSELRKAAEDHTGLPSIPIPESFMPVGRLVELGLVTKAITSFASEMRSATDGPLEAAVGAKQVEVVMVGQGTLAERLRAARAGIPAFFTPVGVGTFTSYGKEVRVFNGQTCVLEEALRADYSLIAAHKADRYGNLVYRGTSRTINPVMAGAAGVTIAEVDEIVPVGALDPEAVVTPGVYVDRVVVRRL